MPEPKRAAKVLRVIVRVDIVYSTENVEEYNSMLSWDMRPETFKIMEESFVTRSHDGIRMAKCGSTSNLKIVGEVIHGNAEDDDD